MSKNYGVHRLSKIGFLHKVQFNLLWKMVLPFREYIETKANVVLCDDASRFPFESLTEILTSPCDHAPIDLYDAFFFVDEMSGEKLFDELYREALDAEIDFTGYGNPTSYDLASLIWLQNPELLQRLHAGMHITKARRFDAFFGQSGGLVPDISKESITELENSLNEYFAGARKGEGVRVFVFQKDCAIWLMIRHGLPMKREAAIADDGRSKGVLFRPEIYDVLMIPSLNDELHIHTSTVGEKRAYCDLVGTHLWKNRDFFTYDKNTPKFTLDPLLVDGRKSLVCSQIEGIESARWIEARFKVPGDYHHIVMHKADCIFAALARIGGIPADFELYRASIRVKFTGDRRTRIVTLCPPMTAIFERESDSLLIEELLKNGGFILNVSENDYDPSIQLFKFPSGDTRNSSGRFAGLASVAR